MRNNKVHLVHLSPLAVEIIGALPKIGERGLVFSTTGDSPIFGFSHGRERLAVAVLELKKSGLVAAGEIAQAEQAEIDHFTIHDLRRTAATGIARIGIAHHALDRVLNHTAGKISGVAAVYNRFEYLDERKAALDAWSRHVESLIRPVPSDVLPLAVSSRSARLG